MQERNAALMARSVCALLWTGREVVVVHGNGPQVGGHPGRLSGRGGRHRQGLRRRRPGHVVLDYGTPRQRPIEEITVDDAERHLAEGQFPEGSMGPKVRAAVRFLRAGGKSP